MSFNTKKPIDVTDFRFKEMRQFRVFDQQLDPHDRYVNLLTVSNKFGLIFIGTSSGVKVVKVADVENTDNGDSKLKKSEAITEYGYQEIVCEQPPCHLALGCDDLTLSVCVSKSGCLQVDLYDVRDFGDEKLLKLPFSNIRLSSTPGLQLLDLRWNPVVPGALTACLSDGSVSAFELGDQPLSVKVIGNLPPTTGATAICYSPKGKQLVLGLINGQLVQYSPELRPVGKTTPPPPELSSASIPPVVGVTWLSSYQFAAVYRVDEQPHLVLVTAPPKNAPPAYSDFEDVCNGFEDQRPAQYFAAHRADWNLLVCASRNSSAVGVLAAVPGAGLPAGASAWEQWTLDDWGRAELPLAGSDDTFPLGMALSTTAQREIFINNDTPALTPRPLLHLLSTSGLLCTYHVISDHADSGINALSPPLQLSVEGSRRASAHHYQQQQTPQQAPPPPPYAGSVKIMDSPRPPFAVTAATTTTTARTPFGQPMSSNGNTTTPIVDSGSATKLPFSFGGSSVIGAATKSGVVAPSSSTAWSIISGTPVSSSTPATFGTSATFSTPAAASAAPATSSAPVQATGSSAATSIWRPQQSSGFSIFAQPTAGHHQQSPPTNMATPNVTITPIQPKPFAASTNPVITPATPQAQQFFGSQSVATAGTGASHSSGDVKPTSSFLSSAATKSSIKTKDAVPSSSSTSQSRSPEPKATTTTKPPPLSSSSRKSPSAQTAMLVALREETRSFSEEVARARQRAAHTLYQVGVEQDKRVVGEALEPLQTFAVDVARATAGLRTDVSGLRGQTLETFASVEESRGLQGRGRDADFLRLLGSRQLDPQSARSMAEIRGLHSALEIRLKEVNEVLDKQWEEFQTEERRVKNAQRRSMPTVPSMELIYRTVLVHQRVTENLRCQIDRMSSNLNQINSRRKSFFRDTFTDSERAKFNRSNTSLSSRQPPQFGSSTSLISMTKNEQSLGLAHRGHHPNDDVSSLSHSMLGFSLVEASGDSSLYSDKRKTMTKQQSLSTEVQLQLRHLLENRPVTRVRPPSPTDFSRLLSPTLLAAEERLRGSNQLRSLSPSLDASPVSSNAGYVAPVDFSSSASTGGLFKPSQMPPLVTSTPFAANKHHQTPLEFGTPNRQQQQQQTMMPPPPPSFMARPVAMSIGDLRSSSSPSRPQSFVAPGPMPAPNIFSVAAAAATSRQAVKGVTPLSSPSFVAVPSPSMSFGTVNDPTSVSATAKKGPFAGSSDSSAASFSFSGLGGGAASVATASSFSFVSNQTTQGAAGSLPILPTFNLFGSGSTGTSGFSAKTPLQGKYEDVTPPPSPRAKNTAKKHSYTAYVEENDDDDEEGELEPGEDDDDEYEDVEGEEEEEEGGSEEYEPGEEIEEGEGSEEPGDEEPETERATEESSTRIILTASKHKLADSASSPSSETTAAPAADIVLDLTKTPARTTRSIPIGSGTESAVDQIVGQMIDSITVTVAPLTAFGSPTTVISFGGSASIFGGTPAPTTTTSSSSAASPSSSAFKFSLPSAITGSPPSASAVAFSFVSPAAGSSSSPPPPQTSITSTVSPTPVIFKPFTPTAVPASEAAPAAEAAASAVVVAPLSPVTTSGTTASDQNLDNFSFSIAPVQPAAPVGSFFGGGAPVGGATGLASPTGSVKTVFGASLSFDSSGDAITTSAGSTSSATASVFGAAGKISFGGTQPAQVSFAFGQTGVSAFGSNPGSAFGSTSLFGQSSTFGQPQQPATSPVSIFGGGQQTSISASGGAGVFAVQAAATGFFSGLGGKASPENATKNIFGGSSSFGATAQQPSTGLFGSPAKLEQTPTAAAPGNFWSKQLSKPGEFGGSFSSGTSSISQTGFGGFQTSPTKPGAFGGSPAFGSAPVFGGSPAFGGGTAFGAAPAEPTGFGSFAANSFSAANNAPTFGSLAAQTSPAPSLFGDASQQQQQQQQQQQSPSVFGGSAPAFGSAAPGSSPSFSQWRS